MSLVLSRLRVEIDGDGIAPFHPHIDNIHNSFFRSGFEAGDTGYFGILSLMNLISPDPRYFRIPASVAAAPS